MKRLQLKFTNVFFVVALIIGLFTFQGVYANVQMKSEKEQEPIVLHIPPGMRLSGIALENKPDYIMLNDDGTLPEIIVIPGDVEIPDEFTLPERIVLIPEIDENGNISSTEIIAPEVTFPIADYVKQLEFAPMLRKDEHMSKLPYASGTLNPYFVSVQAAFSGHCDSGTNYSYTTVPSNSTSFQASSSLPTWVPGDGSAPNWDFAYASGNTYTTLCIPK
ncbi:hypothetical protein MNBD_CHLOROFLEXI01-3133, partial [hydrothermal vent metagenome]